MSIFGGAKTQAAQTTIASGVDIQTSVYGGVVPIAYGVVRLTGNLGWYDDFQAIPQNTGHAGGGKGGVLGGNQNTVSSNTTIYKASFLFFLCEGPVNSINNVWVSKSRGAFADSGFALETGGPGQTPWGYLTTNHPGKDLAYQGSAYVTAQAYSLGNSAQMPNLGFEVDCQGSHAVTGLLDADPAFVVSDFLTSVSYGVGFPSSRLGSLSIFSSYCRAAGLLISPLFDQQQDAASLLNDIVQQCNAEFVWSGAQLTIVPYGDQDLSANGATYTAPGTALYSLTDDDFLDTGSGDPVQVTRARPSDRMNAVSLEWLDRAGNDYNPAVVEAKDQAAIELYGLRTQKARQAHFFCTQPAAMLSATLQVQRQAVRNQYSFTLGWKYCLLDPMDIVEITDSGLGLNQQWVRILSIEEDDNGNLAMVAEEYLGGSGGAPLYGSQPSAPYIANYDIAPGPVNAPIIFEPPPALLAFGEIYNPEVWIGVSGSGIVWGGCNVWLSPDNATYEKIGQIASPARMGTLTANFAVGSDPDTTHTLSVDLLESVATLYAGTLADADAFRTLCFVDGELISYEQATLTGVNAYDLGKHGSSAGYLRRGAFGSVIASHAAGAPFLRLDNNVFKFDLPASYVGQILYVKFTSFNHFGAAEEELASVTAYSYNPNGQGAFVSPPSGCTIAAGTNLQPDGTVVPYVTISWTASTDPLFDQYEVEYKKHTDTAWTAQRVGSGTLSLVVSPLTPGILYDAQVRAVRSAGSGGIALFSAFSVATSISTVGRTTAPGAASGLTLYAGWRQIGVAWTAASDADIGGYEIRYNTVNNVSTATLAGKVLGTSFTITGLADNTAYFVWLKPINTSGVAGSNIGPNSITTLLVPTASLVGQIVGAQIAANTIAASNLISGSDIVQVVSTISAASSSVSSVAFATDTSKISRWNGSAWITAVDGADITAGTVTASKIAAGTITAAQIQASGITGTNIAAGTLTGTNIAGATITGTNIQGGTIQGSNIAANAIDTQQINGQAVTVVNFGNIAGGFSGSGTGVRAFLTSFSISLSISAPVLFHLTLGQGYTSGPQGATIYINLDGTDVASGGSSGAAFNLANVCSAVVSCGAGSHTVTAYWAADTTIVSQGGVLWAVAAKR